MIVPEHWAEAREQARHNDRMVTVRRYGWSDESVHAAQSHAQARAREALDAILAGAALPRRELRTNYGTAGVPIREQIVARHGDVVITRNSYGALCLNTPDVLFADVDLAERPTGCALSIGALAIIAAVAFAVGLFAWHWSAGIGLAIVAAWSLNRIILHRQRAAFDRDGGAEARALALVDAFVATHPDWHLRVYRTPAGLRVLAMHRTFQPQDDDAAMLFSALQADHLYTVMCKVQHCFRARLTPKPWRIGIDQRIRPPVAAWSAEQAMLPERLAWIARYEASSTGHAACRYLRSLGDTTRIDPKAEHVRALHDAMAGAESDLPLA
ncbi:hypothetical protein [Thermomonas carbonis]|uniref:Transmembrane protein n=1 Tax=Thermomonas carbonis TaxID=1463158 RepID=A0A7G9SM97_9GAMM|nr:hypothetical protein [Thermomonas carbonis]QNN68972.1 hypothetical protein H9L16_09570 [Thermomonas carbonis]GHC07570.1 hypothetical protein GCM10010080_22670 [Thermomonas carbonis]